MASSSACVPTEAARSCPGAVGKDGSASPSEVPTNQRFSRLHRLTERRQYQAVYGQGRRVSSSSFSLLGLAHEGDSCRLGLSVSRRVGSAVKRNRVKRLLRDIFRMNRAGLDPALDLVVDARPGIHERTRDEIEREFLESMRRLTARFRR